MEGEREGGRKERGSVRLLTIVPGSSLVHVTVCTFIRTTSPQSGRERKTKKNNILALKGEREDGWTDGWTDRQTKKTRTVSTIKCFVD